MKNKKIFLCFVFLNILLLYLFPQTQEKFIEEYKIGPRDLLNISIFGSEELNRIVRVSEEGKIKFPPLIEEIEVDGLTVGEVEKKLSQLLGEKYLQNPQVIVFIQEHQSKKVSILGAIARPGLYELIGRKKLLQLIAEAGDFSPNAGDEITVVRELEDGTSQTLKILRRDLIRGDASFNIPLKPNDAVYVAAAETVFIYLTGQVRTNGALEVRKDNIPTLYRAIVQAGGFTDRAAKGRVMIRRVGEDGREIQIKVNVNKIMKGEIKDVQLKENDIIYIPETLF